jgi:hypothetical protein
MSGHATDADHAALMFGDAFAAEEAFTGRTLDRGFAQGMIQTALIEEIHGFRRS